MQLREQSREGKKKKADNGWLIQAARQREEG